MGSDESHFNVSVGSDGQSHRTVSTNHHLFEEKGEPKRYGTEVPPLTSLTPYRWATPAHCSELRMILRLLRLPSSRQYGVLLQHGLCFSEPKLIIIVFLFVSGLYALVPKATITQLW